MFKLYVHVHAHTFTCAGNVNWKVNNNKGAGNEEDEESQSYSAWHFLTIFLVIAAVAVMSYVCVHNRKKVIENCMPLHRCIISIKAVTLTIADIVVLP